MVEAFFGLLPHPGNLICGVISILLDRLFFFVFELPFLHHALVSDFNYLFVSDFGHFECLLSLLLLYDDHM